MIVKAEIQSIDYVGNTCIIRMPVFENANGGDKAIATAIFSNTPGIYNGYKEGDVVLVAFENGQLQSPCIIGKLYLGADTESKETRGSINCTTLSTNSKLSLPLTTEITSDDTGEVKVEGAATTYKTLKELVEVTTENTNNIAVLANKTTTFSTNEQAVGIWIDGKTIYRKTFVTDLININTGANVLFSNTGIKGNLVTKIDGIIHDSQNAYSINSWHNQKQTSVYCLATGKIELFCNTDWKNIKIAINIEYTKAE